MRVRALRFAGSSLLASTLLCASSAHAGGFHEDGTYRFDEQAVAKIDFEGDELPPLADPDKEVVPELVEVDDALSGSKVIVLGQYQDVDFLVPVPPDARTYRASMWLRGGDGIAFMGVVRDDLTTSDDVALLYPTGRMTSDGWVEMANREIRVDGAGAQVVMGAFCPSGGCEIDAMELVPDGVPSQPVSPKCKGVTDTTACGVGQICYWGVCRNATGWVPPIPADREDVTAYLENRLRFLFGPYLERSIDLPKALDAFEAMRAAKDPWSYWNAWSLAVRRLHDGHTSVTNVSDVTFENPRPLNVCFVEGLADLSHDLAPADAVYRDVLVSHVGAGPNLGLKAGDRLVRVDGRHPIDWSRALEAEVWGRPAVSNHQTFAEHASALRGDISRFAHQIEVIRCDPQSQKCGPLETIVITELPNLDPEAQIDFVRCDNRPLRHVPDAPQSHAGGYNDVYSGIVNEALPGEKIYGVEWESLSTTNGKNGVGAALTEAMKTIADDGAGAILDHRTGTGGTIAGPMVVWSYAVKRRPLSLYLARQRAEDEQPAKAAGAQLFKQGLLDGEVDFAGSETPLAIPFALLVTQDVSASDWLPLGMKGSPNVRIFGPYQTNGGFSTRFSFGYWLGMSYVFATGDTFLEDGTTLNGTGVEPDVVVLPLQSDLLAGKDTVFEAALAWVRQEVQP